MSEANKREKHPLYDKHHSVETRRKMSLAKLGRKHSEETKRKISLTKLRRKHIDNTK